MANIYDYQAANVRRTWVMFVVFFVVIVGLGYVISEAYGSPDFLIFAIIFVVAYSLISYYASAKIALSLARAKEVQKADNPHALEYRRKFMHRRRFADAEAVYNAGATD